MKNLQIAALALLVVPALMAPTLAQDGPELVKGRTPAVKPATAKPATTRSAKPLNSKARWPEAIKHRNARYAVLTRSFDASGDDHEVFVLSYDLKRLFDRLGDHDEVRKRRQFEKGFKRVIHARLKRDGDPLGDSYQRILATLPLSRRFADFRRTRDLTGDKVELAVWRVDRLRWGDLGAAKIGIAKKREDRKGRLFDERVQDKRQSTKLDQKRTRAEALDENAIEREDARRHRKLERDLDKAEEEAEEEAEDEEKDLEREQERELDEETDKAIESAEEGTSGGE